MASGAITNPLRFLRKKYTEVRGTQWNILKVSRSKLPKTVPVQHIPSCQQLAAPVRYAGLEARWLVVATSK